MNEAMSKTIFCLEKPRGWNARRARAFCAVMVILPEVVKAFEKILIVYSMYTVQNACVNI